MVDLKERNFIEITKADLQRMRGSPPKDHYVEFLKEKLNLKALSDERAQRWPNTIKGLHEKRLQAKKEEQEKLERERLEVDAIEAKLKAERRKEMIERANNLLLLPHMTGLLSKRQRINTTKEREAQIQYKRRVQEIWERQEEKWVQLQKKQLEKWDKQEELKVKRQKELVKALADARLSQLKECEEILMERKRKKEEENKHLKWLEEQDRILEEEKENLKQERKKERTQEMIKANDAQKVKKEEERQRLIKLDKEIEAFGVKKEKMMDERKKLEAMKVTLKAKQRDAISEKLSKELLTTKVDSERKLVLEQSGKKDEEEEKERMRFQRNKKSWEECDKSRKMQVMCKHEQEMRDATNDKYEAERSWERAWQCKSEFEACEKAQLLTNKSFAEHHKRMMDYNNMKMKQAIQCEIDEERQALQRMEDDEINGISLEDIKL